MAAFTSGAGGRLVFWQYQYIHLGLLITSRMVRPWYLPKRIKELRVMGGSSTFIFNLAICAEEKRPGFCCPCRDFDIAVVAFREHLVMECIILDDY